MQAIDQQVKLYNEMVDLEEVWIMLDDYEVPFKKCVLDFFFRDLNGNIFARHFYFSGEIVVLPFLTQMIINTATLKNNAMKIVVPHLIDLITNNTQKSTFGPVTTCKEDVFLNVKHVTGWKNIRREDFYVTSIRTDKMAFVEINTDQRQKIGRSVFSYQYNY